MYRPLEELAQKLNLSVEEIKNSFQEKYKSLVESDDAEDAYLLSKQMEIEPLEQTLAEIFNSYIFQFIRNEDYEDIYSDINQLKDTLHKNIPETTLEYLTEELIKNDKQTKIRYLTEHKNLSLPEDTVIESLISYINDHDSQKFINMYIATNIKMSDEKLNIIYQELAEKGRYVDIKTLEGYFNIKRGKGYATGILKNIGIINIDSN